MEQDNSYKTHQFLMGYYDYHQYQFRDANPFKYAPNSKAYRDWDAGWSEASKACHD